MCISWNNGKCFDTIDVRCKHEDFQCVTLGVHIWKHICWSNVPWEGWATRSRCLAAWGSIVSPVLICCFMRLLIPIGKLITPIPRRTVFGEPQLTSIGGMLFVSCFAKCGVSWNVASVFICLQTVASRICCGHFSNGVRPQFRSCHMAAVMPSFESVSNFFHWMLKAYICTVQTTLLRFDMCYQRSRCLWVWISRTALVS